MIFIFSVKIFILTLYITGKGRYKAIATIKRDPRVI